jgi:hypothetical protein
MRRFAALAFLLLLLPVSASALDCTPFQSWTCVDQGYFDVLNGQPGEVICGVDYTGWTLHVIEVTVTVPGLFIFSGISAAASQVIVDTAIILMDDCAAGTCLDSAQSSGVTDLSVCLDAGTHTFVVASNTTAPTAFMNIGISCPSCVDANNWGFTCVFCQPVDNEDGTWGSMKGHFE